MSYVQFRSGRDALTRSMELDPRGRSGGYPAYKASFTNAISSVLTILYMNSDGIYLTEDKTFKLVMINGEMYFSAHTTLPSYIPEGSIISWNSIWANQKNSPATLAGLVLPMSSPQEALEYIRDNRIPVSFFRDVRENQGRNIPWADKGAWIGSVTATRNVMGDKNDNYARAFFRWWISSDNYSSSFYLAVDKNDRSQWTLQATKLGVPDYQSLGFFQTPVNDAVFVGNWGEGSSARWSYSKDFILRFVIDHVGGYTYQLYDKDGGRRLNQGGQWNREHLNGHPVHVDNGVEFYNDNDIGLMNIDFVVLDNSARAPHIFPLTDTEVYRLGPYVRAMRSMTQDFDFYSINPSSVRANMPAPDYACNMNPWDGKYLSCYSEQLPYTNNMGRTQCMTLDDFANDIHCGLWAASDQETNVDSLLTNLCQYNMGGVSTYNNPPVCNCYQPAFFYEKAITDKSLAGSLAGVRATNNLQCASGTCDQNNSISSKIYYRGNKKCDYCIQVANTSLVAETITDNNIISIQQCAKTDTTYTWNELIGFLIFQGAYQLGGNNPPVVYTDVIISPDKTLIFMNISTRTGKLASDKTSDLVYINTGKLTQYQLTQFPFLAKVSSTSYRLLSEDLWKTNISGYSTDIRSFILIVKVLTQSGQ